MNWQLRYTNIIHEVPLFIRNAKTKIENEKEKERKHEGRPQKGQRYAFDTLDVGWGSKLEYTWGEA